MNKPDFSNIFRTMKNLSGKSVREICSNAQELLTFGKSPTLRRCKTFADGCDLNMTGIICRDRKGNLIYFAENGNAFSVDAFKPIKVEPYAPGIKIVQCNLDSVPLRTFASAAEAGRQLGINSDCITRAARGYPKTSYKRYLWRYYDHSYVPNNTDLLVKN